MTKCLTTLIIALLQCHAADLALVGAKVYPSPTQAAIENGLILIHDGRIAVVGSASAVKIPYETEVIRCDGMVVTAGFWNSHVHLLTPIVSNEPLDAMFNRWGFTTVFDIASVLDSTVALRGRIEKGELRGPRILTTGEPVWSIEPVYVRDFLRENKIAMPAVETPEQAVALVREHARKGANGIKLFTGSMQGGGKVAALPLSVAKAAAQEAHRHRMPVFAHPQNLEGVELAIGSGVDILAHTVPESPEWTAEFVGKLKRAKMALIPTLTLFDFEARRGQMAAADREGWIAKMVAELAAYSRANGEVLFGTDIGYIDHFDTELEFQLMARAGMNFRQILASLTTVPAQRFGLAAHSGRIARGMDADLVVLASDPEQDAAAFSKVRYTVRGGKVIFVAK